LALINNQYLELVEALNLQIIYNKFQGLHPPELVKEYSPLLRYNIKGGIYYTSKKK